MSLNHLYAPETVARYHTEGFWSDGSLWHCLARHDPKSTAVIDGDCTLSYGDLVRLAEQTAKVFAGLGIHRGDVVGVQLPNSGHLVVVLAALLRLGAVYHPLNPAYRQHDLARIFAISKPAAYLYPRRFRQFDYGALAKQLAGEFVALPVDLEQAPGLTGAADPLPSVDTLKADDVFLIGATSGSTGAPKLYVHTQNTQKNEALTLNRALGLGDGDCFLATAPLTHRGTLMFGLLTAITAGAALVVMREYNAAEVLRQIEVHGVSAFMAIPAQVSDLLDLVEQQPGLARSLRVIMISGAPVLPQLVHRLKLALPECTPVTGYGSSETGYSFFTRPEDSLAKLQTCGRTMPGMEARIVDDEIWLRGAFVFSGYHADDRATRAALDEDGWFHTGDLGRLDEEGYLLVTGRRKNLIIRAGLKIQAEELEQLLSLHPLVRQCALVPVPDERLGERAVLFVVPANGAPLSLVDLVTYLDHLGVAKFKWPEALTLISALPVNAVGKLDRQQLREDAQS